PQRPGPDVVHVARDRRVRRDLAERADPVDVVPDALIQVAEREEVQVGHVLPDRSAMISATASSVNLPMPQSVLWITRNSRVPSSQLEISNDRTASSVA